IAGADDELRIGHRRYNWAWYRVATAQDLRTMCADDQGREYEFGVPPPLVRKDLIAQCVTTQRHFCRRNSSIVCTTYTSRSSRRFTTSVHRAWSSAASRWSATRPRRLSAHWLWRF